MIAGDGNFMKQARKLANDNGLADKIIFLGRLTPDRLYDYTVHAWIGLTLFENKGLSNYYSLANRFFDYIQAGVPQLCVEYPAYVDLNKTLKVAVLIRDLSSKTIAKHLNEMLEDDLLHDELQKNCMMARKEWNWQQEERKLVSFYKEIFLS